MKTNEIFKRRKDDLNNLLLLRKSGQQESKKECPHCKSEITRSILKENYKICPNCNHYFPLRPEERIRLLADEKSFRELWKNMVTRNPLDFPEYKEKLDANMEKTKRKEGILAGTMTIGGIKVAIGVMDSRFLMGSMGTVVGEKVTRLAEYATDKKLPLIIFSASGGARMQEGLFSLMQMAKTAAAIERFQSSGGLFISYLTNPTTGGVSASFASLGDIMIGEPEALICFAGPRVIEQTIGQKLPEGFQHAEFLEEHGMLDMVVERKDMKDVLYRILSMHQA